MNHLPMLPPGVLGWLSASATMALLSLIYVLFRQLRAGRVLDIFLASLPLAVLLAAFGARRIFPDLHAPLALVSLVLIGHNAWKFDGRERVASAISLLACLFAVVLAVRIFS